MPLNLWILCILDTNGEILSGVGCLENIFGEIKQNQLADLFFLRCGSAYFFEFISNLIINAMI